MEKPHRFAQLYGYSVCLVAVITLLFSVAAIIGASMDLGDPLRAQIRVQGLNRSLTSFETYKHDLLRQRRDEVSADAPDDETIRGMYEADKAEKIATVRFRSRRNIMVNGLLFLVASALFGFHWLWLRRIRLAPAAQ